MLLSGLRVLEVIDESTAPAGRLLAELGAEVIAVEPPLGSELRSRPPFIDDKKGRNRSLRWWSSSAGKQSFIVDLTEEDGRRKFDGLIETVDVVLEGVQSKLDFLGIGWEHYNSERPDLIWVSVTPYGRNARGVGGPVTDLTLLANGGPLWNCGYDDHSLPPIRGAGDQAFNIGGFYAAISCLVAVVHRDATGRGQLADVSLTAACNVTCEHVTYNWLLLGQECLRQTGRHAAIEPTSRVQVRCADGRYATTGVLPTKPADFAELYRWLGELGLHEDLPESVFLEMAAQREEPVNVSLLGADDEVTATLTAARDAITLIAAHLAADDFYVQSQQRGFPAGAIRSADEGFADEHFTARGFRRTIVHSDLGRTVEYPGSPFLSSRGPMPALRRPPILAEPLGESKGGSPR
jgi:crotonobetainyl-CoA:carnitine CoA-transferase CaiB-like acyl-CoA transferase